MQNKDEYIGSLLLSLFLMQGEVDRLNQTLDLARKGELVYINNPQIAALKADNERLKKDKIGLHSEIKQLEQERYELKKELGTKEIQLANAEFDLHFEETKTRDLVKQIDELKAENARLKSCLQEIKAIVDARCNECKYGKDEISCKYGDCGEAKLHLITQLITKAESEEQ